MAYEVAAQRQWLRSKDKFPYSIEEKLIVNPQPPM